MSNLTFSMGQYAALIPTDRQYTANHMWALPGPSGYRFGLTAYAVRLLSDVYFLEWTVDSGTRLASRQPLGEIESKKAESALFAPAAGRVARFNEELLYDPSIINQDTYGLGWLFDMDEIGDTFMSPDAYIQHLQAAWRATQKLIKEGTCKFL